MAKELDPRLVCQICKQSFNHLGSHIYHKHGMLARDYKAKFGLPYTMPLISTTVKEKKQVAFNKDRKKYLKNIVDGGKENRFKKGQSGHRRISEYERRKFIAQIETVNSNREKRGYEVCIICKMKYRALESHLYNKHGLLLVNRKSYYEE